ncbi:MAG TPA: tetratricopeptide repeat protein [Anaerolineae bacterium]|nr:tetratricopeptide repeat protein [Anaerolineae bacterium]
MPGNRQTHQAALQRAAEYVASKAWTQAIAEYQRALTEFPDDEETWSKTADALERIGRLDGAARAYTAIADLRLRRRDIDAALDIWVRAARLDPNNADVQRRLARVYQQQGRAKLAIRAYLALARIHQKSGQFQEAFEQVQSATALDPNDPDILTALELLRASQPAPASPKPVLARKLDTSIWDLPVESDEGEARGSPIEIAREKALSDLAGSIFEEARPTPVPTRLSKTEIDALVGQAIDAQTRGDTQAAIDAYKRILDAGVDMPAANFNLGLLLQAALHFDEAIRELQRTVAVPEYRLGSLFALGECYRTKGRLDEALNYFLEVLKIVDLGTVRREQADDLIQVYQSLAESYAAKGESEQATQFADALVEFLNGKGWEDKVAEARKRLDQLTIEGGPAITLAELLAVPNATEMLESMALVTEYMKRDKLYSAMEVAYMAIMIAPDYLPLHLRIAEALWSSGRTETALTKYLTVADTYNTRGEARQAIGIYNRILKMAPMDVNVRGRLIDLLVAYGQIDRALEQYLQLADAYYQLADSDKAREVYQDALKLAPRGSPQRTWPAQILHKLGDIYVQRIDWRRALPIYEQIKAMSPHDERARVALIDLYFKTNQLPHAVREIDALLALYKSSGKTDKIIPILDDQVRTHPTDTALRARLAQAYIESKQIPEGIQQLDALGDLQINAGQKREAIATIRAIIALNPPNAAEYRQLLAQLGS